MRILIAYDGSPAGQGLLRTLPTLFPGAAARVLTIYEGPLEMEIALASAGGVGYVGLDEAAWKEFESTAEGEALATARAASEQLTAAGLIVDIEAERGRSGAGTAERLLEAAGSWGADLVATGTRGRGGLQRALLGSTATRLLHRADRPVLVVPADAAPGDGPVVVAYDGSPAARAAVATVAQGVGRRELIVLHVWNAPDTTLGVMTAADAPLDMAPRIDSWMAEQAAVCAEEGAAIAREAGALGRGHAERIVGSLHQGILDIAQREGAAMVATGSRGRGGVASVLLGSVSAGLVHNGRFPTLVVPDPASD